MKQRNSGIDLLRMVSMAMVCMLHVLGQGGILAATAPGSTQKQLAWLLEVGAYGAVNCYGLISGYVGVDANYKYGNILKLWLQTFFYSMGITLVFWLCQPELIDTQKLLSGALPVLKKQYWYFTSYFCLFFFIPYLNKLLHILDRQQMVALVSTIVVLFCCFPLVFGTDLFHTASGYSALWLMLLYLLGGCLKRLEPVRLTKWHCFLIYALGVLLTWWFRGNWVRYTAPTVLLGSMALVVLFAQISIHKLGQKVIALFSPLAFGVYLIHVHPVVWENLMKERFAFLAAYPIWKMFGGVVLAVSAIYLICMAMDALRLFLFRLLHINSLCKQLDTVTVALTGKMTQNSAV